MLVLTQTTDLIEIVLGGAVTTNQLKVTASWRDITTTAYTPGRTVSTTNNTTDVTIIGSPAASTQRVVDLINVYNLDTVAQTVTVKFSDNGTEYILWRGILESSQTLTYTDADGWSLPMPAAGLGGVAISGGLNSRSTGTVSFANSNGVTFGLDGLGVMTASVAAGGGLSAINVSAGTTSNNLSAFTLSNSNGVSFGLNGSVITGSHNGLTSQSNQAFSAPGGSSAFQTLVFANSQGVSWSNSNGSVVASVNTAYRNSTDAIGLNTAQSNVTWTANSSGLSLDARGYAGTVTGATNASVTANSNGVSVSVGNYITTARASNDAIGLNTAQSNVTWTVNSSGLSLDARGYAGTGTSATNASVTLNSNGLAISVAAPAAASINVSAGTTSNNLTALTFSNANGFSFGLNASTITGSYTTLPIATNVNDVGAAGSTGTAASYAPADHVHAGVVRIAAGSNLGNTAGDTQAKHGNWIIVGSNNITISGATGAVSNTMTVRGPDLTQYLTTARASNDGIGLNTAQSNVTWTVNSSGLSLDARGYAGTGTSATNASITMNSNGLAISVGAPAAGVGIAAGTRTATTAGNLLFDNSNGVTFGLNAVGGSIMTASVNTSYRASNDAVGLNTAQTNVTWTVNSSGISINAAGYAGTGTSESGAAAFTLDSNGLAFNANSLAGVGTSATNASITMNSNGLAISVAAPGGGITHSGYFGHYTGNSQVASVLGQRSVYFQPMFVDQAFQFDNMMIPVIYTATSNSSNSFTCRFVVGIYTRNASTFSLLASTSKDFAITNSGTVGNYSLVDGIRLMPIEWTRTVTAGDYYIGIGSSTTTGGGAGMTMSNYVNVQLNSVITGVFGSAANATRGGPMGMGRWGDFTNVVPDSVSIGAISNQNATLARRMPVFYFQSNTF